MRFLKYLGIALASALLSAYAACWLVAPRTIEAPHTVVRPPLKVEQQNGLLLIWGAWETQKGYEAPGTNAIEIRCDQASGRCTEAYASILHHSEGEDLEAQVFDYAVQTWTELEVEAVADRTMGCLTRHLLVDLPAKQARLKWGPGPAEAGCDGDVGDAVLVGDPL
ncbi:MULTISPECIES: hypothetical protein [unclassified Pseudomonas]|uniref:hypothetical protein n=1 Tax=unclassified Pseudomonas TaxID=196821 RepID=UPI00244C2C0C|nr:MULTISPECIES: hypothetical protein [unclassified Pseudomonas]MDG9927965.1 hypothetical protein [Pseudomonas sp. GD04042]MDH0481974.1 hypothetical protein [Pseudomonas sp. GD04015]MDH0604131.1 hypothetical protein [Pseudomonas sp. GD03869]